MPKKPNRITESVVNETLKSYRQQVDEVVQGVRNMSAKIAVLKGRRKTADDVPGIISGLVKQVPRELGKAGDEVRKVLGMRLEQDETRRQSSRSRSQKSSRSKKPSAVSVHKSRVGLAKIKDDKIIDCWTEECTEALGLIVDGAESGVTVSLDENSLRERLALVKHLEAITAVFVRRHAAYLRNLEVDVESSDSGDPHDSVDDGLEDSRDSDDEACGKKNLDDSVFQHEGTPWEAKDIPTSFCDIKKRIDEFRTKDKSSKTKTKRGPRGSEVKDCTLMRMVLVMIMNHPNVLKLNAAGQPSEEYVDFLDHVLARGRFAGTARLLRLMNANAQRVLADPANKCGEVEAEQFAPVVRNWFEWGHGRSKDAQSFFMEACQRNDTELVNAILPAKEGNSLWWEFSLSGNDADTETVFCNKINETYVQPEQIELLRWEVDIGDRRRTNVLLEAMRYGSMEVVSQLLVFCPDLVRVSLLDRNRNETLVSFLRMDDKFFDRRVTHVDRLRLVRKCVGTEPAAWNRFRFEGAACLSVAQFACSEMLHEVLDAVLFCVTTSEQKQEQSKSFNIEDSIKAFIGQVLVTFHGHDTTPMILLSSKKLCSINEAKLLDKIVCTLTMAAMLCCQESSTRSSEQNSPFENEKSNTMTTARRDSLFEEYLNSTNSEPINIMMRLVQRWNGKGRNTASVVRGLPQASLRVAVVDTLRRYRWFVSQDDEMGKVSEASKDKKTQQEKKAMETLMDQVKKKWIDEVQGMQKKA